MANAGAPDSRPAVESFRARRLCEFAITHRICVLIAGPTPATNAFLETLGITLPLPVIHIACDEPAAPYEWEAGGTVVLHDVDRLGLAWQRQLLEWLDTDAGRTQVVSTTSRSLLPLIATGEFLAMLFYRLNTVQISWPDGTQQL